MKVSVFIDVWVKNKQGKQVLYKRTKGNSMVRHLCDVLYAQMTGATYTSGGLNTSNVAKNVAAASMNITAALGSSNGIVPGTGSNAVTISDYKLQTPITHGNGAGNLNFQAQTYPTAPTVSGSSKYFTVQRIFQNNSGGDITVNEYGIVNTNSADLFLLDRTLDTFTIGNGSTGTIRYTIKVTV